MKLVFLKRFDKDLDKISSKLVRNQLADLIELLERVDNISAIPNLKKLKRHHTAYRIRIGDYRVGIFIEENGIEFARIAHRKDIYNIFP